MDDPKTEPPEEKPLELKQSLTLDVMEGMEMPSMSGVVMKNIAHQGARRSSMFTSKPRSFHGKVETMSKGSFSLRGLVDPAVRNVDRSQCGSFALGLIDKSQLEDLSKLATSNLGLPASGLGLPAVSELVKQTESKESVDSQTRRKRNAPQYENTYQLDPTRKPTRKELSGMFDRVLADIPSDLKNSTDFKACVQLGQDLANKVIAECHKLELTRYRFICLSTVISKVGTSAHQASRELWDHSRDTWEEASLKLPVAHIYLQVYFIYLD